MAYEIERTTLAPRDEFFQRFVYARRPVVITNLFENEPIRDVSSLPRAVEVLGDMPLVYQRPTDEDFTGTLAKLMSGQPLAREDLGTQFQTTLKGFAEKLREDPSARIICPEVPPELVEKLSSFFHVPSALGEGVGHSVWLGNAGYQTQLHYDGDYKTILQYQLFGEKRVVLLPAESSGKLLPMVNESLLTPDGLEGPELDAFLAYHGGVHATVRTGEAVLLPSGAWHYFDYRAVSMSLSLRFGQTESQAFMARELHNDQYLQLLGAHLCDPSAHSKLGPAVEKLKTEWAKPGAPLERADRIHRCAQALCREYLELRPEKANRARAAAELIEAKLREQVVLLSGMYR